MDFKKIEKKWRDKWAETKLYQFNKNELDKKYYMLEMFSYPSGAKLHIGHWWNYALSDSYARYKRMKGYNVFHPMGFDAFGLPAENYAIKTGVHPRISTENNIAVMEEQLKGIGGTFDWDYEIKTCDEEYYKWSQWLFLTLYKKGLAYRKFAPVNWCDSCQTVLANEQVVNGCCERCGTEVVKKNMTQWFFKITDYCERLLEGLDRIDWPEKTKALQRNWIGKSEGAEIDFILENGKKITCFTSRADTLYGVKWIVLAPEHQMVKELTTEKQREAVEKYVYESSKKNDIDRQSTVAEKTGVFLGSYAINPINNKKIPIYIGDYVLASYGTGAVMGVPAHDTRDYDFAKKFNIEIERVIDGGDLPFTEYGTLCNSEEFNGMNSKDARHKIVEKLEKEGNGRFKINYKLRDWSVSRQRYWGCPIPIIYCEHCGAVPVPEKDLPVKLPMDVEFKPDGKSPLSKNENYINTVCPICGRPAKRDADTLDTYICSSWYHLRYPNAKNKEVAFDKDFTNAVCPVDKYVGGIEHATGHLLYSRFITKVLYDLGYLNFDEPFKSLVHQGMILGTDGNKMSKSKGNTISIDDKIEEFGSDALRLYLMFGFNYLDGGPWSDDGIKSSSKFLEKVERIVTDVYDLDGEHKLIEKKNNSSLNSRNEKDLEYALNYAIKNIDRDFDKFSFNTCIARVMELVNEMNKYVQNEEINLDLLKNVTKDLIRLLAPALPHMTEELWEQIGEEYSIFNQSYPVCDDSKLVKDENEIAIQVNSKIVGREFVKTDADEEEVLNEIKNVERVKTLIEGKTIVKVIYVKNRLINLIVR